MNTARVVCLGFLIFVSGRRNSIGNPPSPTSETVTLVTHYYHNNFGKLDGGGKLVYQEVEPPFPWDPRWCSTYVYYPGIGKERILLHNSISSMNLFLAAAIKRPQTVRTFVKDRLKLFLEENLGNYGDFTINLHSGDVGLEPISGPPLSPTIRERLRARIQRYGLPCETVVNSNHWTLEENILNDKGGVQHRLFRGRVMPLLIDSFLCETREPNGTFYPVISLH